MRGAEGGGGQRRAFNLPPPPIFPGSAVSQRDPTLFVFAGGVCVCVCLMELSVVLDFGEIGVLMGVPGGWLSWLCVWGGAETILGPWLASPLRWSWGQTFLMDPKAGGERRAARFRGTLSPIGDGGVILMSPRQQR